MEMMKHVDITDEEYEMMKSFDSDEEIEESKPNDNKGEDNEE